jgi:hypothetical protein
MDQVQTCVETLQALAKERPGGNRLIAAEDRINEFARHETIDLRASLEHLLDAIEHEAYKGRSNDTFWLIVEEFVYVHLSKVSEDGAAKDG